MVARDILLAELTGAHVHIAHLSTAGAVRLVREAKARGIRVTAEVTPHHLVLTEEAVRDFDPNTKMNPPLRTKRDTEALLEALADGTIDCIATDHAPHATSEKEGEFDGAPSGIVGLETAIPVLLDRLVRPGVLSLATLVSRCHCRSRSAARPARGHPEHGRTRRCHHPRPRPGTHRRPWAVSFTEPQHALQGLDATRGAGRHHRGRRGGRAVNVARLVLRDGRVFRGYALGAEGEASGEVIFNTAMTGYQEILTDPSYRGQIVAMTYPMIGNYGLNDEDVESRRPWVNGFVVKEASRWPSNFRSRVSLDTYMKSHGIVGTPGNRHARPHSPPSRSRRPGRHHHLGRGRPRTLRARARDLPWTDRTRPGGRGDRGPPLRVGEGPWDLQPGLRRPALAALPGGGLRFGDQAQHPAPAGGRRRAQVTVVPAAAGADEVLEPRARRRLSLQRPRRPRGGALSDRHRAHTPGARARSSGSASGTRSSAWPPGGRTYKLPFGHHGANHPVKDLATGRVEITSQNHGFAVDSGSRWPRAAGRCRT